MNARELTCAARRPAAARGPIIKFLVQIEMAPETRIIWERDSLRQQLQYHATEIVRHGTRGPRPFVTVLEGDL